MPSGLDIAAALCVGLAGVTTALAVLRPTLMRVTITTMRPKGPGRARAS